MNLHALQTSLQAGILGDVSASGLPVLGDERADALTRIAIYAEAYRLRLTEVLSIDFPGLVSLMEHAAFGTLAQAYLHAYPSDRPSVRWLGRHLSVFLENTDPYRGASYLAEMAMFEWAQGEVLDALDEVEADAEAFGQVPPERWPGMRIQLKQALRRLDLNFDVPTIWLALREGSRRGDAPERRAASQPWVIWRDGLEARWRSLPADESFAIDACLAGLTFGELCEGLCAHVEPDSVASRAAAILKQWVVDRLVVGLGEGHQ